MYCRGCFPLKQRIDVDSDEDEDGNLETALLSFKTVWYLVSDVILIWCIFEVILFRKIISNL